MPGQLILYPVMPLFVLFLPNIIPSMNGRKFVPACLPVTCSDSDPLRLCERPRPRPLPLGLPVPVLGGVLICWDVGFRAAALPIADFGPGDIG